MIIPIICGPTGIGKTALSINLAKKLNGEIISVDSMQVYKQMDIGTAKITKEEMENIPHHLIDILELNERFTVVDFKKLALQKIKEIQSRGKTPILVGGTGLYINALIYNYNFENDLKIINKSENEYNKDILKFRNEIDNKLKSGEVKLSELYNMAKEIDEKAILKISPNDKKKIIKILEINNTANTTKSKLDELRKENSDQSLEYIGNYNINTNNFGDKIIESNFNKYMVFELSEDREKLYEKINKRIDIMLNLGLVEEVKNILTSIEKLENDTIENIQKKSTITALQAIGYKEVIRYLLNEISYEEMVELLKRDSRRYAKRQLTWFRKSNYIKLDKQKSDEELINEILNKIKE